MGVTIVQNKILVAILEPTKVAVQTNATKAIAVSVVASQGATGANGAGGDASYVFEFFGQASLAVTHNLNKYPSAHVIDTGGNFWHVIPEYTSANTLEVTLPATMNGKLYLN